MNDRDVLFFANESRDPSHPHICLTVHRHKLIPIENKWKWTVENNRRNVNGLTLWSYPLIYFCFVSPIFSCYGWVGGGSFPSSINFYKHTIIFNLQYSSNTVSMFYIPIIIICTVLREQMILRFWASSSCDCPFTSINLPPDFFFLQPPTESRTTVLLWRGNRFRPADTLRTDPVRSQHLPHRVHRALALSAFWSFTQSVFSCWLA